MHEIVAEMKKICEYIPLIGESSAFQGCSVVFGIGKCIAKIALAESEYYTDSYDKLELTVINPDFGIIDRSYIEFRYVLREIERIKITDHGIEWVADIKKQSLKTEEYKERGDTAFRYFAVFSAKEAGDIQPRTLS